jgi:uncharacterized glyoxalase superfamily protein PhnB
MRLKIDAISVTSKNLKESVKFYKLLGFEFADFSDNEVHIEAITKEGEVRLMIDDAELMKSILGSAPVPSTHSSFAILCETSEKVDEVTGKIKEAGHETVKEPWDAFWGQRYAVVKDPAGYMIDLFAQNN